MINTIRSFITDIITRILHCMCTCQSDCNPPIDEPPLPPPPGKPKRRAANTQPRYDDMRHFVDIDGAILPPPTPHPND